MSMNELCYLIVLHSESGSFGQHVRGGIFGGHLFSLRNIMNRAKQIPSPKNQQQREPTKIYVNTPTIFPISGMSTSELRLLWQRLSHATPKTIEHSHPMSNRAPLERTFIFARLASHSLDGSNIYKC